MKIKTITCHEVYNYGASLQEYALLAYLEKLGHETEAIHYKPSYLSNHFNLWRISNEKYGKNIFLKLIYLALKLPSRLISLKRKKSFDAFSESHIKSTNKKYTTNEELKEDVPEADVYICGSDQIWNSFFQNGKDPAFYLDFVPNSKLKLSYAASFAIDKLEDDIKKFVYEKVSRLNHIAVRESSGKSILKDLGINNVTQVMDPVFLLEKQDWKTLSDKTKEKGNYVFVYDFDSNPLIKKLAIDLKKKHNWNIISVNQNIDYATENYSMKGPERFLSLVENAAFVISNSFHAVAFSIIFRKNFVVFNRKDKINTRMRDLLQSINLSQLLISNEADLEKINSEHLDYTEFKYSLELLIKQSKEYLDKALTV